MEERARKDGNAPSQSSLSCNDSDKDEALTPNNDTRPLWRRLILSKVFWLSTIIAMLLLGLVLGLSIGLTIGKKQPAAASPSAAYTHSPTYTPQQLLGPVVDLGYTKYQGDTYPGGISQWLGVRYAQPPVGDLRFAAPLPVTGNGDLQLATKVFLALSPPLLITS